MLLEEFFGKSHSFTEQYRMAEKQQLESHWDMDKTPREKLLQEAIKITTSDRNKAYGNPEDNFRNIAALWTGYVRAQGVDKDFTPADVASMMTLMKVARLATNPGHRDSALDVAGYAACLADIQETLNAGK